MANSGQSDKLNTKMGFMLNFMDNYYNQLKENVGISANDNEEDIVNHNVSTNDHLKSKTFDKSGGPLDSRKDLNSKL